MKGKEIIRPGGQRVGRDQYYNGACDRTSPDQALDKPPSQPELAAELAPELAAELAPELAMEEQTT